MYSVTIQSSDIQPNRPSSPQQENGNMGQEEQIEEREVLDSIFPDEITGTSASILPSVASPHFPSIYPKKQKNTNQPFDSLTDISETSYRVAIKLDIPRQDDDETKTRSVFFPTHLFLCYGADQPYPIKSPFSSQSPTPHLIPTHPQT